MIVLRENGALKIKTNFNLYDGEYKLERDNFILSESSIIVELEVMKILGKDTISVEMIATGFENINAYKKFITTKNDLAIGDGKIKYEDLKEIYINNKINKQLISSIVVEIMLAYNSEFFIEA